MFHRSCEARKAMRRLAAARSRFYDPAVRGSEFVLWDLPDQKGVERIHRGAFDNVLNRIQRGQFHGRPPEVPGDTIACFNHQRMLILGRASSGTLQLAITPNGVEYTTTPGESQAYRDARDMIKRGDVIGSSFYAHLSKDDFTWDMEGDVAVRNVRSVSFVTDVSPVVDPCYTATTAELRSADSSPVLEAWRSYQAVQSASRRAVEAEAELRERELYLLERGLTK